MLSTDDLKLLQNYPLWMKVEKTKQRIREFYEYYNGEVYVSFSGGKDSTVLLHIARELYPDIEAVFSNTGLEFPEIVEFVKTFNNISIVRPDMNFKKVIETKGYPIVSKSVSNCVRLARKNILEGKDTLRVRQIRGLEVGSKFNKGKWEYLLDAPFLISDECCNELKKKPLKKWQKINNKYPLVAVMADEGGIRREAYLKTGCNSFTAKVSKPMGFWKEDDVLEYIVTNNIPICSVYGHIIQQGDRYYTTKEKRTGCVFCGFGITMEKEPNRYQRLKISHPKLYDYSINKLGFGEVLDYINVKY